MAAWGDSNMLGFHDVGAPAVYTPRIFSRDYWGSDLTELVLIASNDYATIASHSGGGFYGWGALSQHWKGPTRIQYNDPAEWLSDPLVQLIGAGQFWIGITQGGVVYSWSFLARDLACQGPYEVFGRITKVGDCSFNDFFISPLSFSTGEPIRQVGCSSSYCIAITQTTIHFWGYDSSSSFNFPSLSVPARTPVPDKLQAEVPTGFEFTLVAVARRSEPGEWFFVVGRNATHSAVIFTTGQTNSNDMEDSRFMPSSPLGNSQQVFYESSALPTDLEPQWAVAGLRHGVIASPSEIYVWGANDYFQLGVLTDPLAYSATPLRLTSAFPGGTVFAGLSVHRSTTYVLTAAGGLFVFGPSRYCEEYQCREVDAAYYGQPFLEQTREYRPGPVAIPLPIAATHPPVFTKRPMYTDAIGEARYFGASFHVMGTALGANYEVLGPAPDHAVIGWGVNGAVAEDHWMAYGIDVGNYSTSVQRMALQKPTLVGLPKETTSIHSLTSVLHSVGVVVEVDGKQVPYVWGSTSHYEGPCTPYKYENPNYEPEPTSTYTYPVNLVPKLDNATAGGESEIIQMAWGYEGVVVQYANGIISQSDYDPAAWNFVASEADPLDQIVCSRLGCGYLRASNGSLTIWGTDEAYNYESTNYCYFSGYSGQCSDERRIVPVGNPVLKFGLFDLMGVIVTDIPSDCVLTAGHEAFDAPYLGTTENIHSSYQPINFTHLGHNFAGTQVISMSVGSGYSMFIVDDGTRWIFGFGSNTHGQIMGRNYDHGLLPTRLPADWIDSTPTDISCVRKTTFLLSTLGTEQKVYVWGWNGLGQMYGEGHGAIFDSSSSQTAHLFQLPASLGADYIIKSIIKSPDSPTAFAIATTIDARTPYRESKSTSTQPIYAFGADIFEKATTQQWPRMLSQYYGTPTKGTELSRGSILASEEIVKIAVGRFTTWYLTDQNRLYASGNAACLPFIQQSATFDQYDAILWEPRLFLDLSSGTEFITDISAHDSSVTFLLSNRTVGYFVSANSYDCDSKVLGNPVLDDKIPHFLPSRYDAIGCRPQMCCFLNRLTDVLDCFGLENGPSPVVEATIPDSVPVFSIKGKTIDSFYLADEVIIYMDDSGAWVRNSSATVEAITGLEGRTIFQVAQASRHMIVNTDIGMFSLAIVLESQYGHVNHSILTTTQFLPYRPSFTAVQQVAAWGLTSFWQSNGDVWYAGVDIFSLDQFNPASSNWVGYVSTYAILPVPNGLMVDRIFSRLSYDNTVVGSNRIVMMTLKPWTAPSSTPSTPSTPSGPPSAPSQTPVSVTCTGNAPFSNCQCISNVWRCSGSQVVNASAPVAVTNPISIEGDLIVNDPDVLVISIGDLDSTNFGKAVITVSGCVSLLQPITLELNKKAVNAVPTGIDGQEVQILESSCRQPAQTELLRVTQKERQCRKISNQPMESTTDSGRAGISVIFRVQSSTCNYWWIILVSVLGSTIVVVALVLVVFTKFGVVRQIIQPYRGTNT
jgi:hypothetical protein